MVHATLMLDISWWTCASIQQLPTCSTSKVSSTICSCSLVMCQIAQLSRKGLLRFCLQPLMQQNPRNSLSSAICDDEQLPTYSAEATDFAAVQHITRLAAELKQLEHFDVQNLSKLPNQLFKFQEQLLDFQATSGRLLAKSRLSIGMSDSKCKNSLAIPDIITP